MKNKLVVPIFIGLFMFASHPALAEEPQLSATLDKQSARINEEVHLNVKITGIRGSIQAPRLPSLESFEVFYQGRSSRFSFINGQTESLTEFNYVLIPRSVGQFILRPIEVKVDDKTYQTNQLEIRVEDSQTAVSASSQPYRGLTGQSQTKSGYVLPLTPMAPVPQAAPSAPAAQSVTSLQNDLDDNIFMRVTPSAVTVFTNQQLILTYSLFTRYDTRYEGFVEEPETSGFWIEEFPMDQNVGRDTETVNGKRYVRADVKKVALFPTAPGQYQIKPGVVKTSVQIEEPTSPLDEFFNNSFFSGGGLFARRVEKHLIPPVIQITVRPLPETGRPVSFKGAVGDFRMVTDLDKRMVNQNEALTFKIAIEGEGNIETLAQPVLPEIPNVKMYEADTETQLFRTQNVIAGKKTFEVVMIPGEAGEFTIPAIEFSFFNPKMERYIVLKSDPYKIKANPSKTPPPAVPKGIRESELGEETKKAIRSESEDIQYIKERVLSPESRLLPKAVMGLGFLNVLMTIVSSGLAILRRRGEYLDQNVSLKRTLYAKKFAGRGLRHLDRLTKSSEPDEKFFEESAKILNQYLADKLNLSPQNLTLDLIQKHLEEKQAALGLVQNIRGCYEACDQVRFGKLTLEGFDRKSLIERIREIIYLMERK